MRGKSRCLDMCMAKKKNIVYSEESLVMQLLNWRKPPQAPADASWAIVRTVLVPTLNIHVPVFYLPPSSSSISFMYRSQVSMTPS